MKEEIKPGDLAPVELERELSFRKERTTNTIAITAIVAPVVLIVAMIVAGLLIKPENMKVIDLAAVAIATYVGSISKEIGQIYLGSKEEEKE